MKFLRNYELEILTLSGELISIKNPISLDASISRNVLASANSSNIVLYNLKKDTRSKIFKDQYTLSDYMQVVLKAGYITNKEIFKGNISKASSSKKGTTWQTDIECTDGGHALANAYTSQTISKDSSKTDLLTKVIKDLPNIAMGVISPDFTETNKRGKALLGPTVDILKNESNNQFFIDNEKAFCIFDDEVIPGQIIKLDASQLLETPKRQDTILEIKILFQPEINAGQLCEVESLESIYNGQYKIMGFRHDIQIRQDACGISTTTISLNAGAGALKQL